MNSFYERPILNSPYRAPELHHPLDQNGQPLEGEPRQGRRPIALHCPRSGLAEEASAAQASLDLESYTENALINEIRGYVDPWRSLRNPADWGGDRRRPAAPGALAAGLKNGGPGPRPLLLPARSRRDDHLAD